MQEELLAKYAALEAESKALEEKKAVVRAEILNHMVKSATEKVSSPFGSFTVARRTSWLYTPAVLKIEERLKIAKSKEQTKGIAKPVVSEYLLFTKPNV